MMTEHPPEQERAREIAETMLSLGVNGVNRTQKLALARQHLALLAAYEDRSVAFERAAADCVRLEGERDEARREGKLWCAEVARLPSKQAAEAFGRVREALAGGEA